MALVGRRTFRAGPAAQLVGAETLALQLSPECLQLPPGPPSVQGCWGPAGQLSWLCPLPGSRSPPGGGEGKGGEGRGGEET